MRARRRTFAGPGYGANYRTGDAVDAAVRSRLLEASAKTQSEAALAAANAQVFTVEQHLKAVRYL